MNAYGAVMKVQDVLPSLYQARQRRIDLVEFCWFASACGAAPVEIAARLLNQFSDGASRASKGGRAK